MNDEIWRNISRIAGLLEKQAWADGIKEIPQSEIHYRKNKNRVSADAEERGENDTERSQKGIEANKEYGT